MGLISSGFEELQRKLIKMQKIESSPRIAERALEAGAEVLRKEIEKRAPRSSYAGKHLADHVIISKVVNGEIEIGFHKDFFYASFLEWGTSKMPTQAFIEPAYLAVKDEIIKAMTAVYQAELRKI